RGTRSRRARRRRTKMRSRGRWAWRARATRSALHLRGCRATRARSLSLRDELRTLHSFAEIHGRTVTGFSSRVGSVWYPTERQYVADRVRVVPRAVSGRRAPRAAAGTEDALPEMRAHVQCRRSKRWKHWGAFGGAISARCEAELED